MTSTSGFPFAPAYLNLLRSGPPVEEPSSSKKRSKVKKATFISASVGRKLATKKAKAAKMKIIESASITPVVESKQSPVESTVLNTKKVNLTELKRNEGYVGIQSIPPPMRSEYCENRKFHSYSSSPSVIRFDNCCYSLIVAMSKGETKAVSGFCFLNLLKGQVSINGHNLKTGVRTEVINPSWQPAAMVVAECSPNTSSSKKASFMSSIESILESAGLSAKENLSQPEFLKWLNDSDCLVLVEGIPIDSQEWLLAAEDQSLFHEYSSPSYLAHGRQVITNIDNDRPKYWWTDVHGHGKENIFGVVSAIIGEPFTVTRKTDIELLEYMPSWISSVDEMISDSSQSECVASRTVICGAKGVGKSTCLRYTVNRLLSMTDAVAVIDCDLGQPEFTVPGMLSLHIITGPILSPTHMHLTEPLLSYFIGDLTSRNEPEHFARALCALMAKYTTLQDRALKEELKKRKEKEEKGGNSFSLLSEKKMKLKMTPLPLVINTDGSVRYMGAEVLIAVMKLVNPTHVLHISSEKDRDLPALDSIRGPVDCPSLTDINRNTNTNTSTSASASASSHTSKKGTISSIGSSDRVSKGPTGCRLFTLDPGRLRPSKIHSVDLRSLRNVPHLRTKVRKETPLEDRIVPTAGDDTYMPKPDYVPTATHAPLSEPAVQFSSNSSADVMSEEMMCPKEQKTVKKMSKKALALAAGEGMFVRRGSLVDPAGTLALAVMEFQPFRVSMSKVIFQVQSTGLPPRLILAAMNASVVGIVCHATVKRGEECSFAKKVRLSAKPSSVENYADRMQIDDEENRADSTLSNDIESNVEIGEGDVEREGEGSDSSNSCEFEINYTICDDATCERELPTCIGIGIVRAIDLENQLLYILTPIDPSRLNALAGRVCLVRGQLQLPGIMTYAPDVMSEHPYISSEVTGEGSNVMKTRNNMKRRSQQN